MRGRAALALMALLGAPLPARTGDDWRRIVTQTDRDRMNRWRTAWTTALAQARAAGFTADVAAEGRLLDPDAALDRPTPPDGRYRCRTVRIGLPAALPAPPGARAFRRGTTGTCRIADGNLARLDGTQRTAGRLFPGDGVRTPFAGGLSLGDELGEARYGRDPRRSLVGWMERIDTARWRLVLPEPGWEARLQVMEIVPAS